MLIEANPLENTREHRVRQSTLVGGLQHNFAVGGTRRAIECVTDGVVIDEAVESGRATSIKQSDHVCTFCGEIAQHTRQDGRSSNLIGLRHAAVEQFNELMLVGRCEIGEGFNQTPRR